MFTENQHIACYLARHEEFDAMPIIQSICHAKKNCYLPILSAAQENYLEFAAYKPGDTLHPNRYGILEPDNTLEKFSPEQLDVVLEPLVAFDIHGTRLGTGGGYYDRTFNFILKTVSRKPRLIGLAFAAQQADTLPKDKWDVPLDSIITEKKLFTFVGIR